MHSFKFVAAIQAAQAERRGDELSLSCLVELAKEGSANIKLIARELRGGLFARVTPQAHACC
jgi:hypothetical protein